MPVIVCVIVPVFEFVGDCVLVRDTVGCCVGDRVGVPDGGILPVAVWLIVLEGVPVGTAVGVCEGVFKAVDVPDDV